MKSKGILIYFLSVIIILFIIIFILSTYFFNKYEFVLGIGNSMSPTFSNCTLLIINDKINPSEINTGDIILVNVSNINIPNVEFDKIAHRVVENNKNGEWISTRGDNVNVYYSPEQIDGEFGYNKILGRVVYYIKLQKSFCDKKNQK